VDALPWFWIWIVAAAALFIGEMLSLSFFLLPFAIGAVFAAIFNVIGLSLPWQLAIFIVVSGIALAALRPFARKITKKASHAKAGAERLIGMYGAVVEGQSAALEFRVVVGGEPWNARTPEGFKPKVGTTVEVLAIDSNSLVVRALPQAEAEASAAGLSGEGQEKAPPQKTALDGPQFVDVDESRKKSSKEVLP